MILTGSDGRFTASDMERSLEEIPMEELVGAAPYRYEMCAYMSSRSSALLRIWQVQRRQARSGV